MNSPIARFLRFPLSLPALAACLLLGQSSAIAQTMSDLTVPALTGKAITCTITSGNGLLETSGSFDVLLESPGPGQYTIPVSVGSVVAHSGTYTLTQYPPDLAFLKLNGYAPGTDYAEFELHTAAALDSTPGKPFFSLLTVKGGSMQGYKDGWYSIGAPASPAAAPVIGTQPSSQTVSLHDSVTFSVNATGAGLLYQWYKDKLAITGAVSASYSIAKVRPVDAGSYTVTVTNAGGSVSSAAAVLTVNWSRLVNLSILGLSQGRNAPLTAGFVVSGGSKKLLVRAVGPGLSAFGVGGILPNPSMQLHVNVSGTDTVEAGNDDWSDSDAADLRAAFAATGAFTLGAGSKDAALMRTVDGARTVQVMDAADVSGVTLIEVYDAAPDMDGRLANLSARNLAGSGDKMLTIGFSVTGTSNRKVLIRGIGPGLTAFGVTGILPDPKLEVFSIVNGTPSSIATNDNWGSGDVSALRAAFATAGAFNLTDAASKDAALVLSLAPGLYSAQVSSTDARSGDALVEVYELP